MQRSLPSLPTLCGPVQLGCRQDGQWSALHWGQDSPLRRDREQQGLLAAPPEMKPGEQGQTREATGQGGDLARLR